MAYAQYSLTVLLQRLADRYESVPFWDQVEATDALNEGLRTWNMLTGRWVQRITLETTPGTYEYTIPETLSYRTRVLFDNLPMSSSSREDFNNGRPNWRREATNSGGSTPTRPMLWAPVSLMMIYIWPADAPGHHGLTLDGVAATPQLDGADPDNSYVDLGEDDLSILLGFALHVLTFKKGSVWFAATAPYFKAFLLAAAHENQRITQSVFYRKYMGIDQRWMKPLAGTAIASPSLGLVPGGE